MQVPQFLFGTYAEVMARSKKRAVAASKGIFHDDPGSMLDTRSQRGLLLLDGPIPGYSKENHFHCFAVTKAIGSLRIDQAQFISTRDAWLKWSLTEPWRFLGVLGQDSKADLRRNRGLWQPYLQAAVDFWPLLSSEGERYCLSAPTPKDLWNLPTNIRGVLVSLGLPKEKTTGWRPQPLPPGGLAELAKDLLADR
jgi:hypothetical protein